MNPVRMIYVAVRFLLSRSVGFAAAVLLATAACSMADGMPAVVPQASGPETDSNDIYWDDQFDVGPAGPVYAVAADRAGNVYVGGIFTSIGSTVANNIAKWDGTSWSSLGSGVDSVSTTAVYALAVSGSDLYVAGTFTMAGGVSVKNIARWNGASWSALGSGTNGDVYSLAATGSDLYVGGDFTSAGGVNAKNIAKWNGSSWSALAPGTGGAVYAIATNGTGLYAAGDFTTAGLVNASHIARWDGASWSALGNGTSETISALAMVGSDLYAGGNFTTAGLVSAGHIAKWNGSDWSAVGDGTNGYVTALTAIGNTLFVGGGFTLAGEVSAGRIAKWDGVSWSALGSGTDGGVYALAIGGNSLFAGGQFTKAGLKSSVYFAEWQPRVDVTTVTLPANPGVVTIGDSPFGFYRPALMTGSGTTVSYSGGLPASVTLDRAEEIRFTGRRVNGAFTLTPAGMEFGGDGAVLQVEFSEDDVFLFGGVYTDFRAVELTYPADYPANTESVTTTVLANQNAPVPVRVENGKQIYSISAPVTRIGSTYGAVNPAAANVGSIKVTILPTAAVAAGAQWTLDGSTWRSPGTVDDLPVGSYTVTFKTLSGWTTPPTVDVVVKSGVVATATGTYVTAGSLQVTIFPHRAVNAGAKWSIDGGKKWRDPGILDGMSAGAYTVVFKPLSGWTTPADQEITVKSGETTIVRGTYQDTSGPDLMASWRAPVTHKTRSTRQGSRHTLNGRVQVTNAGDEMARNARVRFYLSADGVTTTNTIAEATIRKLKARKTRMVRLRTTLPLGPSPSGQYVIAAVDPDSIIDEQNEDNNQAVSGPVP